MIANDQSILIVGPGKSGTTALYYAVKEGAERALGRPYRGLFEPKEAKSMLAFAQPPSVVKMLQERLTLDDMRSAQIYDKRIYIYRDPRDNITSRVLQWCWSQIPFDDFAAREKLVGLLLKKEADSSSTSLLQLCEVVYNSAQRGKASTARSASILPAKTIRAGIDYFMLRYENFIRGDLNKLSEYLGFPVSLAESEDRQHQYVKRSGTFGDWKAWFTPEDVAYFVTPHRNDYILLGYNPDERSPALQKINPKFGSEFVLRQYAELAKKSRGLPLGTALKSTVNEQPVQIAMRVASTPTAIRKAVFDELVAQIMPTTKKGDLRQSNALATQAGILAAKNDDQAQLLKAAGHLESFGDYSNAGSLLARASRLREPSALPEWDGKAAKNKRLLISDGRGDLGRVIRLAHLGSLVTWDFRSCTALVDRRLLGLFRRSFPKVDFIDALSNSGDKKFDIGADWATLMQFCSLGDVAGAAYMPLQPDPIRVKAFRTAYSRPDLPLIGISWSGMISEVSRGGAHDAWAKALSLREAVYISLGNEAASDVAAIQKLGGPQILYGGVVDVDDLDGQAAQVAAMDAVVTAPNVVAHLAGALMIPTAVLLDAHPQAVWPAVGVATPWAPSLALVRSDNEDTDILGAAMTTISQLLRPA